MKKEKSDNAMKTEYDFSKGVRGKHYKGYRAGHSVKVDEEDGSVTRQFFSLQDGAVILDPDLRSCFPNSEAVNKALRDHLSHQA